jgi:hypothetical protein
MAVATATVLMPVASTTMAVTKNGVGFGGDDYSYINSSNGGGNGDDDNGGGDSEGGGLRQQSTQSDSGRNDGGSDGNGGCDGEDNDDNSQLELATMMVIMATSRPRW